MRASTISSLFGLGFFTLLALGLGGCPQSTSEPCQGSQCQLLQDDGGVEERTKRPASLTISNVTVDGNPSRKVRQGFGGAPSNGTTTVHLFGAHLESATNVTVGDGPDALPGTITSKTSTELTFTVGIRHGAPIGSQQVKVTAPDASATFADAIVITAITAAPSGSDDLDVGLDSAGTDEDPVRSMAKGIMLAAAGDTVFLKNGTYDMDHGETFAIATKHQLIPNVPPDITIKGESRNGTLLQGPIVTDCSISDNHFVGLATAGIARIETLGIFGFCTSGISAKSGVAIREVTIRGVGTGISAGPNVTIDSVDISEADEGVLLSNRTGAVTISNSHVHHSSTAIYGVAEGHLVLIASEIDHSGPRNDVPSRGGIVVSGPTTIADVKIHENESFGVTTSEFGSTVPLDITRSQFWGNRSAAIFVSAPGTLKVRRSTFNHDSKAIHVTSDSTVIDLGTPDSPGENSFTICSTCDGVFDARPAAVEQLRPITLTGNIWSGGEPPRGCSDVDHPRRTDPPRLWHMENPGTCGSKGNVIVN
ncbi:right-handed parallel beta-helix repeat-containing protein [Pendulispora brunnea]|uniref:Right-handed parallel beta-helix repeat-containing protein n=1 Tax=Pendulispora brunnea TaxID=2905690 RepID=A0ABZ2KMZ0_9BACT